MQWKDAGRALWPPVTQQTMETSPVADAPGESYLKIANSRADRALHISAENMTKARKFVLAKRFVGEPKESDLKLVEEELPPLRDKEVLVEAEWLSVDPYMKPYSAWLPVGTTMLGGQVARVIESCNPDVKVGDRLMGYFGWRDKTVVDMRQSNNLPMPEKPYVLPDFEGLPASLGVGVLGMPGNTAYFGFLEICRPQPGEVVVVSGAAGAVGSLVGQIAKLKGCKVIGFAGTDDKVRWLKEELNFDEAFNYKTENPTLVLKQAAPEGVDCYFDNAGGELSSSILNRMNQGGRIAVCGSTSSYNAGKLKYRETVTEGFENMPKAFIGMLRGENTGKAVRTGDWCCTDVRSFDPFRYNQNPYIRGSEPALAWRESGKPFRKKTTLSSPDRDSNLDLPRPQQSSFNTTTSALANYATEAAPDDRDKIPKTATSSLRQQHAPNDRDKFPTTATSSRRPQQAPEDRDTLPTTATSSRRPQQAPEDRDKLPTTATSSQIPQQAPYDSDTLPTTATSSL
uniref:Prostaglandin reductase 1 n=1 Tax=Timema poppense TaxID=170557 RepID=A0A7R9DF32_TIMPO|nr:unnamed protein product [Timema poppensis]